MTEWEIVVDTPSSCVRRIQVPGGWLYQVIDCTTLDDDGSYGWHPPVFVPRTEHLRTINKPFDPPSGGF